MQFLLIFRCRRKRASYPRDGRMEHVEEPAQGAFVDARRQCTVLKLAFGAQAASQGSYRRRLLDNGQPHYPSTCIFAPARSCAGYYWPLIDSLGAASMQRWHYSNPIRLKQMSYTKSGRKCQTPNR